MSTRDSLPPSNSLTDSNKILTENYPSPPSSPGGLHPATQNNTPPYDPTLTDASLDQLRALPPVAHAIIQMRKSFPPLSEQQLAAIELLVLGHIDTFVAAKLDVHRVTVTKWRLYNPYFRAALARRRQEVWGSSADRFRKTINRALSVLKHQLKSDDAQVSHRAARTLLTLAYSKNLAPPDDPIDPAGVMERIARQKKIEWHFSNDPAKDELDEEDYLRAMKYLDLLQRNFPLAKDDLVNLGATSPSTSTSTPG
jgi:hypothetical protein